MVKKTPSNYHLFVSFDGQNPIIPEFDDLPLQPSIFININLQRFPLYDNWLERYVYERYVERISNPIFINIRKTRIFV